MKRLTNVVKIRHFAIVDDVKIHLVAIVVYVLQVLHLIQEPEDAKVDKNDHKFLHHIFNSILCYDVNFYICVS